MEDKMIDIEVIRQTPEKKQITLADVPDGWAFRLVGDNADNWRLRLHSINIYCMVRTFGFRECNTNDDSPELLVSEVGKFNGTVIVKEIV
jgi:hypothetical protein